VVAKPVTGRTTADSDRDDRPARACARHEIDRVRSCGAGLIKSVATVPVFGRWSPASAAGLIGSYAFNQPTDA